MSTLANACFHIAAISIAVVIILLRQQLQLHQSHVFAVATTTAILKTCQCYVAICYSYVEILFYTQNLSVFANMFFNQVDWSTIQISFSEHKQQWRGRY